ncbi:unnamed protein product [Diabrotica balteata]|uniref:C-type lectin domain-containing protein n=1 Tax=Diabrotica balteata TaxID=107213 RepID=A0A9N9T7K1_DIABA|nr:unnamed protein product [Diabrotica balteata]
MKAECLIVMILLICAQAFNVPNNGSTQHWFKINDTNYVIELAITANFWSAMEYCTSHNMQLVSMDTLEENSEVYAQVSNIVLNNSLNFWSAGNILGDDKSIWIWMTTGKVISINSWRAREPNTQRLTDLCLSLLYPKDENGWWTAHPCTTRDAFICKQ